MTTPAARFYVTTEALDSWLELAQAHAEDLDDTVGALARALATLVEAYAHARHPGAAWPAADLIPEGAERAVEALTADERDAIEVTAELAGLMRRIIGDGIAAPHDWAEAANTIHHLQATLMAQAATRAYPTMLRPLGDTIED